MNRPVRLLHPWNGFPKGKVFTDMPGGQARTLVGQNLAVFDDEQAASKDVSAAPNNRMIGGRGAGKGRVTR